MYTCENCGKEFELPVLVDTGGEYGGTAHSEPASPCCEDNFEEVEGKPLTKIEYIEYMSKKQKQYIQ